MIVLAALLLAPAHAATPAATAPAAARDFVTRLYARYERGNLQPAVAEAQIYAPELVRQMALNGKLHGPEEVGLIDYDPICQCQDLADLKAAIGPVKPAGPGRAMVKVSLRFGPGSDRRSLRLQLVRTAAGWRVGDIATKAQPSLLGGLQSENRRMSRGR
ncbi:MAG: hypothetical protein JWP15_696 [Alphaproteobacteria bacterium]|nr:hypothetical protein [Alphaproteobacteria bacterium]